MTINVPELPESKIGMIENIAKTDVPIKIAVHVVTSFSYI